MPELPEVETIRRQLCDAGVPGRTIQKPLIEWAGTVEPLSPALFCKKTKGRRIERISRHGKWLIFELDGEENLLVHLRMTGGFYLSQNRLKKGPHDRVILQLSGGLNLHFRDPRKFGRWRFGGFPEGLGPDGLGIEAKLFFDILEKSSRQLKAFLLDQSRIAGIGNIYADEALFEARLHPLRRTDSLSGKEKTALYNAIKKVLRAGVENGGTSLGKGQGNYVDLNGNSGGFREKTNVYGRAGQPCKICETLLKKTTVAQRTTVFCPACQPSVS